MKWKEVCDRIKKKAKRKIDMKMQTAKRILAGVVLVLSFFLLMSFCAYGVIAEEEEPFLKIAGRSLSLKDSVYITYYVDTNGAKEDISMLYYTSSKEAYTVETADSRSECLGTVSIEGKEYAVFRYTKLTAKQMTDTVYARAYIRGNGTDYYSNTDKYSIAMYAYNKRGTEEDALCRAMLAYGGEAQLRFSYRTEDLASAVHHMVTVEGGVLEDGFSYGLYVENAMATVRAEAKEGEIFSCWTVNGISVSQDETYSFPVTEAVNLVASFQAAAHEHAYIETVEREATCSQTGQKRYTCACGDSYTEELPLLPHTESVEEGKEATCTEAGWTNKVVCSVCGTILQEGTELPAKGHEIVNHAGQDASCAEAGWKPYESCTRCDYTTYEEIPKLPHAYSGDVCLSCGKEFYSDGLEFSISGDSCVVVGYIGTEGELVLPAVYEGYPLTSVAQEVLQSVHTIFYRGSEGEWSGIEGAASFEGTVYFYAETQPSEAGNYWYHIDGTIYLWG